MNEIRLNLGSGKDYRKGYINVDLYEENPELVDQRFDVSKIPYPDNSVDEIMALHVIEHFDWHAGNKTIQEWARVLKPGGKLIIETPDFLECCRDFAYGSSETKLELYNVFFAAHWLPGQGHKFLFTEEQLRIQLGWAGFTTMKRIPPLSIYVTAKSYNWLLAMEVYK